jgi:ribonuclease P/MRP protein subunit POP1
MDTHLYQRNCYPFHLIGPATVIWRPVTNVAHGSSGAGSEDGKNVETADKGKGKGKDIEALSTAAEPHKHRTVWIRSHPAVFEDVFQTLQVSASFALEEYKDRKDDSGKKMVYEIEIDDLRGSVNVFEITGPKASQVIKGALNPVDIRKRPEFKKVGWPL